jgi:hypothetical protein
MAKSKRQAYQGGFKRPSRPRILILLAPPPVAPPTERYATRVLFVPKGGLHKRVVKQRRSPSQIQVFAPPVAVPSERYATRVAILPLDGLRKRVVKQPSRPARIQVFAPPPAQPAERYETRRLLLALTAVRRYHRRQVPARFTFTWPTGLEAAEAAWLKLSRITQSRHHRWRQSYPRRLQILAPPPPPSERYATRVLIRPLDGLHKRVVKQSGRPARFQILAPPLAQPAERYATRLELRPLIGRSRRHVRKLSPSRWMQIFAPPVVQAPERYATRVLMRPLARAPFKRAQEIPASMLRLQIFAPPPPPTPNKGANLSMMGVG